MSLKGRQAVTMCIVVNALFGFATVAFVLMLGSSVSANGQSPPALDSEALARRTPKTWGVAKVAATEHFGAEELARFGAYRAAQRRVDLLGLLLALASYALFLGPLGRWLYRRCEGAAGRWAARWPWRRLPRLGRLGGRVLGPSWAAALLFAGAYFACGALLDLPLGAYKTLLARDVGLSTIGPGLWIKDALVGLGLSVLAFSFLVLGLFGLVRRFPRRWWLLLGLPVALVLAAMMILSPLSARIHHRLTPIEKSAFAQRRDLIGRIHALARAQGLTLASIRVIDQSRRGRGLNAYVDGLGPTRELVLADTLLAAATDGEICVAVAHELGHLQARRDVILRGLASALALIAFLALLAWLLRWGARRLALDSPGDVRLLPLVGLLALLLFNLGLPLRNALSRHRELEADKHALVLTDDPRSFVSLQVKVARRNLADVDPSAWVRLWLQSHPSALERIGLAEFYARHRGLRRRAGSPPPPRR